MKKLPPFALKTAIVAVLAGSIAYFGVETRFLEASSHREAPMIANDPIADNTDLYAFRSPDNPNTVTIIANYIGLELPQGGPNYATFGEDVRYEVHIKTNPLSFGDDLVYRFTFSKVNEDPTTFFNIRLGKQNLKTTYLLERRFGNNGNWREDRRGCGRELTSARTRQREHLDHCRIPLARPRPGDRCRTQ